MHVRLTCGYHVRHGGADYARQTTPHGGQTFDAPPTWDVAHHGGWMSYLKPSRAEASGEGWAAPSSAEPKPSSLIGL